MDSHWRGLDATSTRRTHEYGGGSRGPRRRRLESPSVWPTPRRRRRVLRLHHVVRNLLGRRGSDSYGSSSKQWAFEACDPQDIYMYGRTAKDDKRRGYRFFGRYIESHERAKKPEKTIQEVISEETDKKHDKSREKCSS